MKNSPPLSKEQQTAIKAVLQCTNAFNCKHCIEVGGGYNGERYECFRCGDSYYLDYDEMR